MEISFFDGGNVGIGATVPLGSLHIARNGGTPAILVGEAGDVGDVNIRAARDTGGNGATALTIQTTRSSASEDQLSFYTGQRAEFFGSLGIGYKPGDSSNNLYVAGDVGIGTSSPSETLEVNGSFGLRDDANDYGKLEVDCDGTSCYAVYAPLIKLMDYGMRDLWRSIYASEIQANG